MEDKKDIPTENQKSLARERSLSMKCSCSACDSLICFTKRRLPICLCNDCKKSKTCLFKDHENNVKGTNADQITEAYLNTAKCAKTSKIDPTVLTTSGINFDLDRKRAIESNKPKPKSLDEYLSILVPETKTSKVNYKMKPESLAQYIDIITGNIPSKDKESSLDIYIRNFKEAKYKKLSENLSQHSKELEVKTNAGTNTCKGTCKKCRQKKYTQIQNVMLTTPIINLNPRTAKLSSEVMDLSYKASSSSISAISKISELSTDNTQTFKYDFFNYDIFKRIKEVYNACSCKVCECIPTKILKSDICNCKPCDCIVCTRYKNTLETKRISKPIYHLKCSCNKYKKDTKKSFINKSKDCSCEPCNCAQCQNKDFLKSCNCKPCQCVDCKQILPLYQVFRGEVHQNSPCHCLPCKCTECLRRYGASSKDIVHEVSTTTSRQSQCQCELCPNDTCKDSLETCKCENRNIFRKPIERVRHDYDIRTATIINDIYHHANDVNEIEEQNAKAMVAALAQKYQQSSNIKICSCEECEYINYESQEDAINAIKSSRLFSCDSNLSITNEMPRKNCNYKPCEYIKEGKISHIKQYKSPRQALSLLRSSNYNVYDCIGDCAVIKKANQHGSKASVSKHSFANLYNHAFMLGSWPIKKGDVLTPSAHQSKIQKQMMVKAKFSTKLAAFKTRSLNKIVCVDLNTSQKPLNNYNKPKQCYPKVVIPGSLGQLNETNYLNKYKIGNEDSTELTKYYKTNDVLQCNAYSQSQVSKEDIHNLKYDLKQNVSGSNISEFSSSGTTSKISFCKQDNEITTINEQTKKDWHNNNYGLNHNHPSYIIRFPRSTVETCLNDVLKSDLGNKIKLTHLDMSSMRSEYLSENSIPLSENFNPEISVPSFIDIKESNINKHHNMMQKNVVKLANYQNPVANVKNHNFIRLGKINTFTSNKYEPTRKQVGSYQTHLVHGYNCYSCYNLSNIKSNNYGKDEDSCAKLRNSPYTYFGNVVEDLNTKKNHERVHETLKDAQTFYLHLLKVLEKYEKANREFQSISDKLKVSHMYLIGEKNTNKNDNHDINDVETDDLNEHSKEIPTHLPVVSNVARYNIKFENVQDSTNRQKPVLANLTKTISNQDRIFLCNTESGILKDKNVINQNIKLKSSKVTLYPEHVSCTDVNINQLNENITNRNFYNNNLQDSKKLKEKSNNESKQKSESNRIGLTNYNTNVKNIFIFNTNENCLTKSEVNRTTSVKFENQHSIKKLYHSLENFHSMRLPTEEVSKPIYIDNIDIAEDENSNLFNNFKTERKEKRPCSTFNDNCSFTEKTNNENKAINCYSFSEIKVNNSQSILHLIDTDKKPDSIHENKFLSSEDQKVKFESVRKVSAHSILIKWRPPLDLRNVRGYEMLVEGRAVQKIFSPLNCIAVVTCLPQSAKIDITIRTITHSPSKKHPTATVVYQPPYNKNDFII